MANIKDIPNQERPYEKMLMYGEKSLTNSELLSIIIKTGTKENSALEIAQRLMKQAQETSNSLRFLQNMSITELTKINGIGKVKAIELKAVGEIAKRISKPLINGQIIINCKQDIANLFMEELQNEKSEVLKIVLLNNKNMVKKILSIAVGNEENISINIKAILAEPVKMQIPRIILVHNHPSGNPTPSKADVEFTSKIVRSASLLDIQVLDHIVIGDGIYESILERKII